MDREQVYELRFQGSIIPVFGQLEPDLLSRIKRAIRGLEYVVFSTLTTTGVPVEKFEYSEDTVRLKKKKDGE